jgi:hypothetical protein
VLISDLRALNDFFSSLIISPYAKESAACCVLENGGSQKKYQKKLSMKTWTLVPNLPIKGISLVSTLLCLYLTSACQNAKYG